MQFDTRSLWIYLHFNKLQLNVIEHSQEADSGVADTPRAIYEVQHNQLVQINAAAQKKGIKVGMGLAASSLLYPDLKLHEYRPEVEENTLEQLANALYLLTSDIVIIPPQGIVLRAQNMLNLYGGLSPYWQNIRRCIAKYHFDYQCAAAFSIQAAKVMAKNGNGLICEQRDKIKEALKRCPLVLSDIETKDIEKLKRIGVHKVAELDNIPFSELANRMSRISINVISELRGQSPSKVSFFKPPTKYDDYIELLYDISLTEKLIPVIVHALHKLEDFLYARNAHCLQVNITFYQREHESMLVTFNSAMPIYKSTDWLDIIELKLEQIHFQSPVYALKLCCHKHERAENSHGDFFARKSTHLAAMSLLSRLGSKLGEKRVSTLKFVADFRPEKCSHTPQYRKVVSKVNKQSIFADRPGFLLPQPKLLEQKVKVLKGPERIVCGWWDDSTNSEKPDNNNVNKHVSRDYYIGQSHQGQQLWMFKTPEQKWYLHGYFV